jgi:hypothetical protein
MERLNFEFITDVLGVAPGRKSGRGRYFPVDHDEYIQIRFFACPIDGYEVRITGKSAKYRTSAKCI